MPFNPSYHVGEARKAYTFLAGPVGCLMLHGFMGSPISSRPMAEYLTARGITVHCPLLPGHGEFPNKLYKIPREAWIAEAEEALILVRQHCDEIFLMGHSMGTILCAHLASQNDNIRGLIMLAPALNVPDRRIRLVSVLRYVMPWFYPLKMKSLHELVYERLHDYDPTLDFDDPAVQAKLPEMTRVPTSGIDEMRKVVEMGQKLWPIMDLPATIFQGGRDVAVSPETAQKIYELLPTEDKQMHFFEEAGHELMRPFEAVHARVWPEVYDFIRVRSSLREIAVERGP